MYVPGSKNPLIVLTFILHLNQKWEMHVFGTKTILMVLKSFYTQIDYKFRRLGFGAHQHGTGTTCHASRIHGNGACPRRAGTGFHWEP